MSRHFKMITMEEFQKKLLPILTEDFPYELPDTIHEDLKKVSFDYENHEPSINEDNPIQSLSNVQGFANYPCGLMTLPNGMPVLFVNAGGDWEFPICYIIYFDGKKLRGYIPQKGNMWNRKFKSAFGSEDIGYNDEESAKDFNISISDFITEAAEWCTTGDLKATHEDMNSAYQSFATDYPDDCNRAEMARGFIDEFNITSTDAIIDDIMKRIIEKK